MAVVGPARGLSRFLCASRGSRRRDQSGDAHARLQPVQRAAGRRDRTSIRGGGRAAAPVAAQPKRGPLPEQDHRQAGGEDSGRALSLRDQGGERLRDQRLLAARWTDVREPRPRRGGAKRGGAGRCPGPRDVPRGPAPRDPPGLEGLSRPGRTWDTRRAAGEERQQHSADRERGRRPGAECGLPEVQPRRRVPGRPARSADHGRSRVQPGGHGYPLRAAPQRAGP